MPKRKNYANVRDEESERTRAELWIILAIALVVIVGGLIFRAVKHKPAAPPLDSNISMSGSSQPNLPAAAAGVQAPHPPPATPRGP
jgi:hypothetical protein